MRNVAVVGLGYVGLPLALLSSSKGHHVVGIDMDQGKVDLINRKIDPLHDEFVSKLISSTDLEASTDSTRISEADVVLVCVPTPVKDDYMPDLAPLRGAVEAVGKNMGKATLVIIESTVNPGVSEEVVIPLLEQSSNMKVNQDFFVVHCPERINPGDPKWNVENIPRVIGGSCEDATKEAVMFYESILDADIKAMGSLKEAEACKVVENSFRDINIAFVNELAMSFETLGINVKNVIDGAATKPFAFMPHYPSIGVGGHCIPVDPYYLIEYAKTAGFEHKFLSLARSINNQMPMFTITVLENELRSEGINLSEAKVALLGLSYKPNVADDRESPSYKLLANLQSKGAQVTTFDPYFLDKSDVETIEDAIKDADAIVVAVNHKEFLDFDFSSCTAKVFIDGKNAFDSSLLPQGIRYKGIGA